MISVHIAWAIAVYVLIAIYQGLFWWSLIPKQRNTEHITDTSDPLFNIKGKTIIYATFWIVVYVVAITVGIIKSLKKNNYYTVFHRG